MSAIIRVPYSDEKFKELEDVNRKINHDTTYKTDKEQYGLNEYWAAISAKGYGDCEDYCISKIYLLRQLGWPKESLDIAICQVPDGEYHAVLIAHTDKADYVLDLAEDYVSEWKYINYTWVEMSQGGSFLDWVKITK